MGLVGLNGIGFVLDRVWLNLEPWVLWTVGIVSIVLAIAGPTIFRVLQTVDKSEMNDQPRAIVGGHSANVSHVVAGGDVTVNLGDHKYGGQMTESPRRPTVMPELLAEFEQLYAEGNSLLTRGALPPREWRQRIIGWFERAEGLVTDHRSGEAFMFRTISKKPTVNEKFDDCPDLLKARLAKLRLIIGRMPSGET